MLQTLFRFRGVDYKGNMIPESYEILQKAASKVRLIHLKQTKEFSLSEPEFEFMYVLPSQTKQSPIRTDAELMEAINQAF